VQYLINGIKTRAKAASTHFRAASRPDLQGRKELWLDLQKTQAEDKLRIVFTSPDLLMGEGDPESLLEGR